MTPMMPAGISPTTCAWERTFTLCIWAIRKTFSPYPKQAEAIASGFDKDRSGGFRQHEFLPRKATKLNLEWVLLRVSLLPVLPRSEQRVPRLRRRLPGL